MPDPSLANLSGARSVVERRWYGMPMLLLALGLLSVALLVGTQLLRERLIDSDVARVAGLLEIETNLTIAHLWVEEYVTGDDVAMEPVWRGLDHAERAIDQLLGEETGPPPVLPPLVEPQLVMQAARIRSLVEQFEDISKHRHEGYDLGRDVSIGSPIDIEYDRVFSEVFLETEGLQAALSARLTQSYARSRALFQLILMAWVALIGLAIAALWSRERRRAKAEEALRDSQEQLLQAQKMDAIGRLAGGMAHDINNYLGAMTSQCEVVRLQLGPEHPVAVKMDAVIATAFKASGLIRRLLAFSRQQPTEPEVVYLNRVIEDLDKMMRRLIGEAVEITYQLAEDLWPVEVDPAQIEQVIVNLLVNARDAMPAGGRVTIETANWRAAEVLSQVPTLSVDGDAVLLSVSDSGEGIATKAIDKIFEPFYTTKGETHQGTGLGLSTAYGIVESHGGRIWVTNQEPSGARFDILLPRSAKEITAPVPIELSQPQRSGEAERILLVEDNAELRHSTAAILEALGYRVGVAENGQQALRMFEEGWGDAAILITDVVMPGMSGQEISELLRAKNPHLGVLFVSGYTGDVMSDHGFVSGEEAFLEKPFSASRLAEKVGAVLERRRQSLDSPAQT